MANSKMAVKLDKRALETLERLLPGAADDFVQTLAFEGERLVKTSIGSGRPGRSYKRRGRLHVASAPGSPPNTDTGKLINAITIFKPQERQRIISTGDTEYAAALEYGTSKMAARPYMRPMIVALKPLIDPLLKRMMDSLL